MATSTNDELVRTGTARARVLLASRGTRAIATYLMVAPSSAVLSTFVGSMSEYRFPHPLLTTSFHLAISLATILFLSVSSRQLLLRISSQSLSTRAPRTPHLRLLHYLTSLSPPSSLNKLSRSLTPYLFTCSLCAVLAALSEIRALQITDPQFWSLGRLLPLPLMFITSVIRDRDLPSSHGTVQAIFVWFILVAGKGVRWNAGLEGWGCAVVSALSVSGWVWAVGCGWKEADQTKDEVQRTPPTIFLYLTLTNLLLLVPLLLSNEIPSALKSGHFGFFSEPGFWVQEFVMAWCGLASLITFWSLMTHLEPLSLFVVVGLKDAVMPYVYSYMFGNPVDLFAKPTMRPGQQMLALLAVAVYTVVDAWDTVRDNNSVKTK